jgi:hypothetical protein
MSCGDKVNDPMESVGRSCGAKSKEYEVRKKNSLKTTGYFVFLFVTHDLIPRNFLYEVDIGGVYPTGISRFRLYFTYKKKEATRNIKLTTFAQPS